MVEGVENTFTKMGEQLNTLSQEVTKINQKNDLHEKKIQALEGQGEVFKGEVTNIVDNQGQWHAYFDEKITDLGRDGADVNYRLSQIEVWVNAQIYAQKQQQVSQGPRQNILKIGMNMVEGIC